jgi:hypothetical protein
MTLERHHHRSFGGNEATGSIERLAQQRARLQERGILLGSLVAAHEAHERAQPHSIPTREDDHPEMSAQRSRRFDEMP